MSDRGTERGADSEAYLSSCWPPSAKATLQRKTDDEGSQGRSLGLLLPDLHIYAALLCTRHGLGSPEQTHIGRQPPFCPHLRTVLLPCCPY